MAMRPFYQIVGERALRETRTVTVAEGIALPAGEYAFMEFYCDDPRCDCRRVIFQVWRKDTATKIWATITYGWDTPEYYAQWSHWGPGPEANEMASATLEPISPQTELSTMLLGMFEEVLLGDEAYVARLKRHYQEARTSRVSKVVSRADKLSPADKRRLRLKKLRGR